MGVELPYVHVKTWGSKRGRVFIKGGTFAGDYGIIDIQSTNVFCKSTLYCNYYCQLMTSHCYV